MDGRPPNPVGYRTGDPVMKNFDAIKALRLPHYDQQPIYDASLYKNDPVKPYGLLSEAEKEAKKQEIARMAYFQRIASAQNAAKKRAEKKKNYYK